MAEHFEKLAAISRYDVITAQKKLNTSEPIIIVIAADTYLHFVDFEPDEIDIMVSRKVPSGRAILSTQTLVNAHLYSAN